MTRILIVDDDADIRELVTRRVGKEGYRVAAASSAEEAIAMVDERGAPDLAILDVSLPGMDGLELLSELRSRDGMADLPAIFLSARVQESDIVAGQRLGAAYLTKPFVASALLGKIRQLLDDAASSRELTGW